MRPFASRRILLGVTGGIASYKAGWLARLLAQAGAEVDVVLTAGVQEFVRPRSDTKRPLGHTSILHAADVEDDRNLPRHSAELGE